MRRLSGARFTDRSRQHPITENTHVPRRMRKQVAAPIEPPCNAPPRRVYSVYEAPRKKALLARLRCCRSIRRLSSLNRLRLRGIGSLQLLKPFGFLLVLLLHVPAALLELVVRFCQSVKS